MKTIGLLGGTSWESSIVYERIINEEVQQRLGGSHSADLLIRSCDFAVVERLQSAGAWKQVGRLLAADARLQRPRPVRTTADPRRTPAPRPGAGAHSRSAPVATSPPASTTTCSPASSGRSPPRRREPAVMTKPITRSTPPEEVMSKLCPLLECNRAFAATGAHAGLAMNQLFGLRMVQSGEGRRVRLHLEVLS
jgi:hypothetical protein